MTASARPVWYKPWSARKKPPANNPPPSPQVQARINEEADASGYNRVFATASRLNRPLRTPTPNNVNDPIFPPPSTNNVNRPNFAQPSPDVNQFNRKSFSQDEVDRMIAEHRATYAAINGPTPAGAFNRSPPIKQDRSG